MQIFHQALIPFLQVLIILYAMRLVEAKEDDFQCDVCRAVVREANWKINKADQKKLVQVGSFRVDSHGNQNIKEKKYARSESHVEDIFETICDMMIDYAELTNEDGTKEIVRAIRIDGTRLNTKDYSLNKDIGKKLRYKCDNFLENHEESVMLQLQQDNLEDYEKIICGEKTGVCPDEQLSRPITELPEAKYEEPEEMDEEEEEGDITDELEEGKSDENEENQVSPESKEIPAMDTDSSHTNEKEEL